jgi:site-specific recombinase XerD
VSLLRNITSGFRSLFQKEQVDRFWGSGRVSSQIANQVISFLQPNAMGLLAMERKLCTTLTRPKRLAGAAKIRAGVSRRFHDLRHTGCTRMLEAGVPFSVVATIMGWSPSTTVRMSRRYGHIGQTAQRHAVNALSEAGIQDDGKQNWAQSLRGVHPCSETGFLGTHAVA